MNSNAKFYFWSTLYKIMLEIVYYLIIAPIYSYMGLVWEPNYLFLLLSYLIFFLILIILPKSQVRPSHQLIKLLFVVTIIPLLSFLWQANDNINYVVLVSLCFILLSILARIKPIRIPLLKKETIFNIEFINIIFILNIFILIFFTIQYGGIDYRAFDFTAVYDLRKEISYSGIWVYLNNWLGTLLIPICIVIYLYKGKKLLFLLSCLMQVYLYLCTGEKTILFSVILLTGTTFILIQNKWDVWLPKMYFYLVIFSGVLYFITNNAFSVGLFPVRHLNLPANISFKYYEFFSQNSKLQYTEGFIGKLLGTESPYSIKAAYIISGNSSHENTGFLADAYANGGILAMILVTIFLWLILVYIDSISLKTKKPFLFTAITVYYFIVLNDGALQTSLITFGFGLLLVFMYLIASDEILKSNLGETKNN